jgi:hypothetical protein
LTIRVIGPAPWKKSTIPSPSSQLAFTLFGITTSFRPPCNWPFCVFTTSKLTLNHTKTFLSQTSQVGFHPLTLAYQTLLPLVLQVRFHPVRTSKLLSSSVDGLVCVFDTSGKLDDEDCMETVLPVNTSVSSFGFYGALGENVWCLTNVETLRQGLIAVCSVLGVTF